MSESKGLSEVQVDYMTATAMVANYIAALRDWTLEAAEPERVANVTASDAAIAKGLEQLLGQTVRELAGADEGFEALLAGRLMWSIEQVEEMVDEIEKEIKNEGV